MATWSPLLLAAACASLASASCGTQHNDTMHLQRLRKDLLCLYDREAGPTTLPSARTTVRLRFLRTRMDVDEADNSLTLLGYVMLMWEDDWLRWEPNRYGGAKRLYVDWREIWTPSVVMVEAPTKVLSASQEALIVNGTVIWTILAPLRAPCRNDPTRWPYDAMVCNISLGNLSSDRARLENSQVQMNVIKWKSRGWGMQSLGMRPFKATGFEEGLCIELVARRTADLLEATVVLPAVAVCVLLLAVPWLPADAPHRPLLLCTVVLLQVLLCGVLAVRVGVVGSHAPGALLLLRDALALSAVVLLQWLLARHLVTDPVWLGPGALWAPIDALANWLSGPRLTALLALPADGSPADGEDKDHRLRSVRSARVAALMDRVTFVGLAMALAGLCGRLLP